MATKLDQEESISKKTCTTCSATFEISGPSEKPDYERYVNNYYCSSKCSIGLRESRDMWNLSVTIRAAYTAMLMRLSQQGVVRYSPEHDRSYFPGFNVCRVDKETLRKFDWEDHVRVYNDGARRYYEAEDPEFLNKLDMSMAGLEKTMCDSRLAALVPPRSPLGSAMLDLDFRFDHPSTTEGGPSSYIFTTNMTYWGHEVNSDGVL